MWQSAWLLVAGALKPPDQAPSPTCPFIKNQQCQRAARDRTSGQPMYPDLNRGSGYPNLLATNTAPGENRQRRVGEGHLGPTPDSVNAFFESFFEEPFSPIDSKELTACRGSRSDMGTMALFSRAASGGCPLCRVIRSFQEIVVWTEEEGDCLWVSSSP